MSAYKMQALFRRFDGQGFIIVGCTSSPRPICADPDVVLVKDAGGIYKPIDPHLDFTYDDQYFWRPYIPVSTSVSFWKPTLWIYRCATHDLVKTNHDDTFAVSLGVAQDILDWVYWIGLATEELSTRCVAKGVCPSSLPKPLNFPSLREDLRRNHPSVDLAYDSIWTIRRPLLEWLGVFLYLFPTGQGFTQLPNFPNHMEAISILQNAKRRGVLIDIDTPKQPQLRARFNRWLQDRVPVAYRYDQATHKDLRYSFWQYGKRQDLTWNGLKSTPILLSWVAHGYGDTVAYACSKTEARNLQEACQFVRYFDFWEQINYLVFYLDIVLDEAYQPEDVSTSDRKTINLPSLAKFVDATTDTQAKRLHADIQRRSKYRPYQQFESPPSTPPQPKRTKLSDMFSAEEMVELLGPTYRPAKDQEVGVEEQASTPMEIDPTPSIDNTHSAEEFLTDLAQSITFSQAFPAAVEQPIVRYSPSNDVCPPDQQSDDHRTTIHISLLIPNPDESWCRSQSRNDVLDSKDVRELRAFISSGKQGMLSRCTDLRWTHQPLDVSPSFMNECVVAIPPLTELCLLTVDHRPVKPVLLLLECIRRGMRFRLGWRESYGFRLLSGVPTSAKPEWLQLPIPLLQVPKKHDTMDLVKIWYKMLATFMEREGVQRYLQYGGLVARIMYECLPNCQRGFLEGPSVLFTKYGHYYKDHSRGCITELPIDISQDDGLNVILGGFEHPKVSLWPPLTTFESSQLWHGEWSEEAEDWFVTRWEALTAHNTHHREFRAYSNKEWGQNFKGHSSNRSREACQVKKGVDALVMTVKNMPRAEDCPIPHSGSIFMSPPELR